jgi:four helix bundle protein
MAGVRTHEKLDVWKLSDELVTRVRQIVKTAGIRSDFQLRDQLSRAAEKICPNIAEGFSRFHPRDNARFVRTAKSSITEVIVHLEAAVAKGYLKESDIQIPRRFARRARGAATQYIIYLETAEAPSPAESPSEP